MPRTDRVFSENQRMLARIPYRQSPISNQRCEAVHSEALVGGRDDFNVRRFARYKTSHLADEFGAVIQAAIPGKDGARCRYIRLRFETGFVGRMEGAIENADVSRIIGASVVCAIRSYGCLRLFEIVPVHRFTIQIPSSKLKAHG